MDQCCAFENPALLRLSAKVWVKNHVRSGFNVKGYWRGFGPDPVFDTTPNAAQAKATIDFKDQRGHNNTTPLEINWDAMSRAMNAAGVVVGPNTHIRLRLRNQHGGEQGLTQKIGKDEYRVVIHVAAKPAYEDRHLYVMNNSLVHELRHVAQEQSDEDFGVKYYAQNMSIGGYAKNKYEVEARTFGHLADITGKKDLGNLATKAPGKALWGLTPATTTKPVPGLVIHEKAVA